MQVRYSTRSVISFKGVVIFLSSKKTGLNMIHHDALLQVIFKLKVLEHESPYKNDMKEHKSYTKIE